ncbi:MAG: DEAD/DEAH box helicase family protein [Bacilli bacterium]|nr:DEAD/DEAH box helicase family protein [Bacilli bacterium]
MAGENSRSNIYPVLNLQYKLSEEQEGISRRVLENYKEGKDTLINAVCGAGKTELVFPVMQYALINKLSIAFAIPRRDVVIELYHRICEAFPHSKIVAVYGGHTSKLEGDIVVLTTHQLYRYPKYFDLIILDEIDAFPYSGNILINKIFQNSIKGHMVQMSATPNEQVLEFFKGKNREILELNTRFHKHPLPVPIIKRRIGIIQFIELIFLLKKFVDKKKPVFIFVPTIEIGEKLYSVLRVLFKCGELVHSKVKNREQIIQNFRKGKYKYLVTTAVLERGVTVKNLQVVIYHADHKLYNQYNLVQISGRVGRKYDAPKGEVIFLGSKITDEMLKAKETIKAKNKYL